MFGSIQNRRAFTASLMSVLALPALGQSASNILSAPDARMMLKTGSLILLDVRSQSEWLETGLAKGAWPVSLHEADFSQRLSEIFRRHGDSQIAIICAVGGRSSRVTQVLNQNGISGIFDLSEGMLGNDRGPGWIARGFEVVSLEEAQAEYSAAMQTSD